MIIFWKICLSSAFSNIAFTAHKTDGSLSSTKKIPPHLFIGYRRDKETLQVLMRKLSMHQFSTQASFGNFREMSCVTLFTSPTHFGMCCQEVFSPMSFSSNSGNRRRHNTFRYSDIQYDGWRGNAKRQENKKKKTTVNLCQVCFLHSKIVQI